MLSVQRESKRELRICPKTPRNAYYARISFLCSGIGFVQSAKRARIRSLRAKKSEIGRYNSARTEKSVRIRPPKMYTFDDSATRKIETFPSRVSRLRFAHRSNIMGACCGTDSLATVKRRFRGNPPHDRHPNTWAGSMGVFRGIDWHSSCFNRMEFALFFLKE